MLCFKIIGLLHLEKIFNGFYHIKAWCSHLGHVTKTTGPGSSSGRVSALGSGGRGFNTWPRHTKGVKNGTSGYLAWCSAL